MQKDVLIQRKNSHLNFTLIFSKCPNLRKHLNIWLWPYYCIPTTSTCMSLSLFIFVYSLWLSFPNPGKLLRISQRTRNSLEVVGKSFINKYLANRCVYSYGYQFPLGWNGSLRRIVMDGVTRCAGSFWKILTHFCAENTRLSFLHFSPILFYPASPFQLSAVPHTWLLW